MDIFCESAHCDKHETGSKAECQLNEDAFYIEFLVWMMSVNTFHNAIVLIWFVPACTLIHGNGSGQRDPALAVVRQFKKKI